MPPTLSPAFPIKLSLNNKKLDEVLSNILSCVLPAPHRNFYLHAILIVIEVLYLDKMGVVVSAYFFHSRGTCSVIVSVSQNLLLLSE